MRLSRKIGQLSSISGLKYHNMGQKRSKERMMEIIFENPGSHLTVREMSRLVKTPKSTVQRHLDALKEQGLLTKDNEPAQSLSFRMRKIAYYLIRMHDSGLVDYLVESLNPEAIILFGSFRKGESVKGSDIDIFVLTHERKALDLSRFERGLGHKVDLHLEKSLAKVDAGLLNNIVNGIKIYGSFKVR